MSPSWKRPCHSHPREGTGDRDKLHMVVTTEAAIPRRVLRPDRPTLEDTIHPILEVPKPPRKLRAALTRQTLELLNLTLLPKTAHSPSTLPAKPLRPRPRTRPLPTRPTAPPLSQRPTSTVTVRSRPTITRRNSARRPTTAPPTTPRSATQPGSRRICSPSPSSSRRSRPAEGRTNTRPLSTRQRTPPLITHLRKRNRRSRHHNSPQCTLTPPMRRQAVSPFHRPCSSRSRRSQISRPTAPRRRLSNSRRTRTRGRTEARQRHISPRRTSRCRAGGRRRSKTRRRRSHIISRRRCRAARRQARGRFRT